MAAELRDAGGEDNFPERCTVAQQAQRDLRVFEQRELVEQLAEFIKSPITETR